MSFITQESGIILSSTGETTLLDCGPMIREGQEKYVLQENNGTIIYDGLCLPSTEFDCDSSRVTVDSGKFISIVNVCNLPITVTGFRNTDPQRFSIFKYPDYADYPEYNTENTSELPFTLQPFQRMVIDTFFHPLVSELMTGHPGTLENRDGDKFSAKINILPGFEVMNCKQPDYVSVMWWESYDCYGAGENLILRNDGHIGSGQWFEESGDSNYMPREQIFYAEDEGNQFFEPSGLNLSVTEYPELESNYCKPSFLLEGEFLCSINNTDFLNNQENFIDPDLSTIEKIQNQHFLNKKKTIELNTSDEVSIENVFTGLRDISLTYASMLENMKPNWYETYGNLGISGSLGVFNSMVDQLIQAGQHNDINNLLQSTFPPTQVNYQDKIMQVSYESNNTGVVDLDGYSWTGMIVRVEPVQNARDLSDQAVFFNAGIVQGAAEDVRMFIVDSGDFDAYPMEEII